MVSFDGLCDSPLDRKPCDSRLLCKYISPHPFNDGLRWGLGIQLLAVVFVVDVVSDTDKFARVVGTGEQDDSNAQDLGGRETS